MEYLKFECKMFNAIRIWLVIRQWVQNTIMQLLSVCNYEKSIYNSRQQYYLKQTNCYHEWFSSVMISQWGRAPIQSRVKWVSKSSYIIPYWNYILSMKERHSPPSRKYHFKGDFVPWLTIRCLKILGTQMRAPDSTYILRMTKKVVSQWHGETETTQSTEKWTSESKNSVFHKSSIII